MGKRNRNVDPEVRAVKSVELAESRMGKALKFIGLVANLAAPVYEYTDEQKAQIITALDEAVQNVKDRFAGKTANKGGFRLQ